VKELRHPVGRNPAGGLGQVGAGLQMRFQRCPV
jgi:hypothetical protein